MKIKNTKLLPLILTIIIFFIFSPQKTSAQTSSPMVWHELMSNPANISFLNIPFDSLDIQLNTHQKVRHWGRLRPRFTDQLVEVEVAYKQQFLPASRILGFSNGGDYYRSVRLKHRFHVFAKQVVKGSLSLYQAESYLNAAAGELDIMAQDGYQNTLLLGQGGTFEGFEKSNMYFVASQQDTTRIEPVDAKTFGDIYLRKTPKSYRMMTGYKPQGKVTRRILESSLFLSGIAYILMRTEMNRSIGRMFKNESNPPPNYLGGIFLGTGLLYFTHRLVFKNKKLTPKAMKAIIELHNEELLSQ